MSVAIRYLLACDCGRKIPVETRQAGQTIVCACGTALEVPTLLGLRALEQEAPLAAAAPSPLAAWGVRQAVALVGLAVLLGALAGAVYLCFYRPALPIVAEDQIRDYVSGLPPQELYKHWRELRALGLDPRDTAMVDAYKEYAFRYRLWWAAVLVAAVVGLAAIVVPLVRARRTVLAPRPREPS